MTHTGRHQLIKNFKMFLQIKVNSTLNPEFNLQTQALPSYSHSNPDLWNRELVQI